MAMDPKNNDSPAPKLSIEQARIAYNRLSRSRLMDQSEAQRLRRAALDDMEEASWECAARRWERASRHTEAANWAFAQMEVLLWKVLGSEIEPTIKTELVWDDFEDAMTAGREYRKPVA